MVEGSSAGNSALGSVVSHWPFFNVALKSALVVVFCCYSVLVFLVFVEPLLKGF